MARIPEKTKEMILQKILESRALLYDAKNVNEEEWEKIADFAKTLNYNRDYKFIKTSFMRNQKLSLLRFLNKSNQPLPRVHQLTIQILWNNSENSKDEELSTSVNDAEDKEMNQTSSKENKMKDVSNLSTKRSRKRTKTSTNDDDANDEDSEEKEQRKQITDMKRRKLELEIEQMILQIEKKKKDDSKVSQSDEENSTTNDLSYYN